jgi:hypothetical protein
MLAHAYITKPCDVSAIVKDFKDVPFDSFVFKAAAKAFKETVNNEKLTISRVKTIDDKHFVDNANDLRVGQFANSMVQSALDSQHLITVHRISNAVEALPICEEPALISVHFTDPKADVIYNGESTFDIAADNNETGDIVLLD